MTSTTTTKRGTLSARDATLKVLADADEPLASKVICKRVRAMRGVKLGGKTPNATIAKEISRLVQDGKVKRAERGIYASLDQTDPEPVKKLDEPKVEKPKQEDAIEADLKRGTAKAKAKGKDEVTPDPKPTKQPKRSRRAKATA